MSLLELCRPALNAEKNDETSASILYAKAMKHLGCVIDSLFLARNMESIASIIRKAVQEITGADGTLFNLVETETGSNKNKTVSFPKRPEPPVGRYLTMQVMLTGTPVVVEDIHCDDRIPAYVPKPGSITSIVVVPIRPDIAVGAIGAYWSRKHSSAHEVVKVLGFLGDFAFSALHNVRVHREMARTEKALRESEQRYRTMGEILPYGIWWSDEKGRAEYVSPSFLNLLDMTMEEVRDFGWSSRLVEEDMESTKRKWFDSVRTGNPWDHRFRIRDSEGRVRTVHSRGFPVRDRKGKIVSWAGINLDITDQKRAEDALRESEARLRLAVESAGLGTWEFDPLSGAIKWSSRCRALLGVPEEAPGDYRTFLGLVHPDDRDRIQRKVLRALDPAGPGSYDAEYRLVRSDGSERWVMAKGKALFGTVGGKRRAIRFIGTGMDITEQKHMEDSLRRARDELESRVRERTAELKRSNRALRGYAAKLEKLNVELEEFAFVAAHDLQEPLRKIRTFGDMLSTKCAGTLCSEAKDYIKRINNAAHYMSRLLHSLLSYSRLTARPDSFDLVDLGRTVREVLVNMEPDLKQADPTVEIDTLPNIRADSELMRQLFLHLICNAIKFHKENKRPAVKIYSRIEGGTFRVFVEDNGIGFEQNYIDRIFKPFQQLHGKNSPYGGTGMGLAICRKIVEMHGGTLTATSEPGRGSTFIIELPLRQNGTEMAA